MEKFRTEVEKCNIKARWQKQRELRDNEEQNRKIESGDTDINVVKKNPNHIDFTTIRATDLKNNKRVIITKPDDDEEEIRRNSVKKELELVFVNYMKDNCDKSGNLKESNLSKKQVNSIKTLKDNMKDEDLVCMETDKTGKFGLDKKENYVRKMKKHMKNDDTIKMKDVRKIEKELNNQSESLIGIVNAGSNNGHTKRIRSNLKTVDNQVPVLSGTHKDHKKVDDLVEGPDLRGIMGATVGPNFALTNFIAKEIIRKVAEAASVCNDCKSTEELLSKFEEYNRTRIVDDNGSKNIFVASMDIDKWFPSMKNRPMTKEIRNMIIESTIEFKEINYDKISKHLGENMTIEEILEENMEELLYLTKSKLDKLMKIKAERIIIAKNVDSNVKRRIETGTTSNITIETFGETMVNGQRDLTESVENDGYTESRDSGDVTIANDDEVLDNKNIAENVDLNIAENVDLNIAENVDLNIAENIDLNIAEKVELNMNIEKDRDTESTDSGDVTIAYDDEVPDNKNTAENVDLNINGKRKMENTQYITNSDSNNVTTFNDEGNKPNAQKCVEHEQKEKESKRTDSGDVTLAYDDEQNEAHKAVSSNKEQSKTGIRNSINENKEEDNDKSLKTSDKDVKKKHKMKDLDSDDATPANRDAEDAIIAPTKIPDDEQKRQMFSKSVEIMILAGMENHVYTFGMKLRSKRKVALLDYLSQEK